MRAALFWDFTQRKRTFSYRRFGTTQRSHLQVSSTPRRILLGLRCFGILRNVKRHFLTDVSGQPIVPSSFIKHSKKNSSWTALFWDFTQLKRAFSYGRCAVSKFYAAYKGIYLPTFRDNPSDSSSSIKHSKKNSSWTALFWEFTA
jgi:hypothetical protein